MRLDSERGMTLVEMLFAAAISVLLLSSIVAFGFLVQKAKAEYQANVEITTDARTVLEQMVWGRHLGGQANRRGIIEAVTATVSLRQIDYTDVDGTTHSVRQNGGNIEYRRGTIGAWKALSNLDTTRYSTDLRFTQTNPRAVQVQLVFGKNVKGVWRYASLSTQIAFRGV